MSGPLMPTPAAVMQAMTLLAKGTDKTPGIGELIGVDVGGATTDIYSIAEGMPRQMNRVYKGLPEPYVKRTVEGDIGMRYSIEGVLAAVGAQRLAELSGFRRSGWRRSCSCLRTIRRRCRSTIRSWRCLITRSPPWPCRPP